MTDAVREHERIEEIPRLERVHECRRRAVYRKGSWK
jgi:hypothetical protein